jgi:hypothetical protein
MATAVGWQRQAESSELADGVAVSTRAINKPALAAATHASTTYQFVLADSRAHQARHREAETTGGSS